MNEFNGRNFPFSRTRFALEGGIRETALDAAGARIGVAMSVREFVFWMFVGPWPIEGIPAALPVGFVVEAVASCKKCWKFWTWSGVKVVKSLLNARWTAETSFPAMLERRILICVYPPICYGVVDEGAGTEVFAKERSWVLCKVSCVRMRMMG